MTKTMLLASIVFTAACATDATSDHGNPVASYTSRTGTTIEIYAEGANAYSVAEIGNSGQLLSVGTDDVKALSPTQIYLESSTDTAVPEEIAALTQALVAAGAQFSSTAPAPKIAVQAFDGCTASSFSATWCHLGDNDPITWCLLNQTNNEQKHMSALSSTSAGLCVKSGHADYHITNEVGGDHEWSMGTGGFIKYSFSSAIFSHNWVHYDITQVTGTFQFGGEADD